LRNLEEDRRELAGCSCSFPFTYHGNSYSQCSTEDSGGKFTEKPWCPTATTGGAFVVGSGTFVYCKDACPGDDVYRKSIGLAPLTTTTTGSVSTSSVT